MRFYDNTRLSAHRSCPRKYFYRHVMHLTTDGISDALSFGLAWHSAMDVLWRDVADGVKDDVEVIKRAFKEGFHKTWVEQGMTPLGEWTEDDTQDHKPRTPYVALGMLEGYLGLRRKTIETEYKLLEIEQPFVVPLDPSNPDLWYCGRNDKVVERDGRVYILDHKTTTAYKRDGYFRSTFIDAFSPDSQMEGYSFSGHMKYDDAFGGIYIDASLVHINVHEGHQLIPLLSGDECLDQWLWEARHEVQRIEEYERKITMGAGDEGHMEAFPRNTQACFNFGSACPFLDLCKAWDNPLVELEEKGIPVDYKVEKWEPFDVNHLETIGMKKD